MNEKEKRIKRLLHQSWYRGCKETDIVLGKFAKEYLHTLSNDELDWFEGLLQENDNDIWDWVTGKNPIPLNYNTTLMQKIISFNNA